MPTIFTHAVVGMGLTSLAPLPRRPPWLWALAAGLAMLPDADVVALVAGLRYDSMLSHRGLSHSLPAAALIGALTAVMTRRALGGRLVALATYFAAVTASHGVLDAFTNGGLGVAFLAPLAHERYFFPWRPVEVSPLGLAFFSAWGVRVLASEIAWIWLPMGALVVGARLLQALRHRARGG